MRKEEKTQEGQAEEGARRPETADNSADKAQKTDETTRSQDGAAPGTPELEKKLDEINDKYLRLYSEYDNYRKRTIREKADIIRTGGEDVLKAILPVIDDFERALKANEMVEETAPIKEGMQLIYNKLMAAVRQKGLEPFESTGQPFDAETMEAVTHLPADEKCPAGHVADELEKGYRIGDKVIRYAKVVVAK